MKNPRKTDRNLPEGSEKNWERLYTAVKDSYAPKGKCIKGK